MEREATYTIAELGELAGVTRRTVRYYVRRGLLQPPLGTGRGPHYDDAHLRRLIEIRDLQAGGMALDAIARRVAGTAEGDEVAAAALPMPKPSLWQRLELAPGIELHIDRRRAADPAMLAELIRMAHGLLAQQPPHTRGDRTNDAD